MPYRGQLLGSRPVRGRKTESWVRRMEKLSPEGEIMRQLPMTKTEAHRATSNNFSGEELDELLRSMEDRGLIVISERRGKRGRPAVILERKEESCP